MVMPVMWVIPSTNMPGVYVEGRYLPLVIEDDMGSSNYKHIKITLFTLISSHESLYVFLQGGVLCCGFWLCGT